MYLFKKQLGIFFCILMFFSAYVQEFNFDMVSLSKYYELPETFIFSTAAPHYFYTILTPPNCLKTGQGYGEVLTGYENYRPCLDRSKAVSETAHVYLGSSKNIFITNYEPSSSVRSFVSKNMSGPSFGYEAASDFIAFAEQYNGLESLTLVNHKVHSLEGLEIIENLKYLELSVSYIEDWSYISNLSQLEVLNLACSNVVNEDLYHIAKSQSIKTLVLDGTEISDLSALNGMTNLQNLLLKVTNISEFEQLDVLQPLALRWISFDPSLSRPALLNLNPKVEPTLFVTAHTLKPVHGTFIDMQYPARNCNEINYLPIRVW